jgi:acetyl-CoA carboxylase biotin carboxyl carrier protein
MLRSITKIAGQPIARRRRRSDAAVSKRERGQREHQDDQRETELSDRRPSRTSSRELTARARTDEHIGPEHSLVAPSIQLPGERKSSDRVGPIPETGGYSPLGPRAQEGAVTDVEAHITGTVWKIEVEVGDSVQEGDTVVILESMKMEMPVEAEDPGVVTEIRCHEGQSVSEGDTLVVLD